MKKYSLIGIIGLLIIGIGAGIWYILQSPQWLWLFQSTPSSLFSHLPTTVDQAMNIDITPETKSFLLQTNQWFDPQTFSSVLDSITAITIAQAPKWTDDVYSVIILQGNEQFSIDQVQALWLLYFDTWYESKQIQPSIWLYGDHDSVAYFSTATTSLTTEKDVQYVLREAKQQQASVIFFSKPSTQIGADPLTMAFAQKLQYTALYWSPSTSQSKGTFVLQFSGTNFTTSDEIFTPHHQDRISDQTLLYVEWKQLLSTFGVTQTQFELWFPLLLTQALPGVDNLLSSQQITDLYSAFNKHVWIILDVTENTFWLGLHLRMDSPKTYDSLVSLQPIWRSLASAFIWSGNVYEQNDTNSWSLNIDLNAGSWNVTTWSQDNWISLPLLTIAKDTKNTTLSILPSLLPQQAISDDLMYDAWSFLTVRYDPNPLIKMAGVNPVIGNFITQMEMLWTGAILWHVRIDAEQQQLVATFATK